MDVCSPKNAFVTEVFVINGGHVEIGAPLVQMDTDAEDRALERLRLTEHARQLRSAQYQGEELQLLLNIAQLTVDSAQSRSDTSAKPGPGVAQATAVMNKNDYQKAVQRQRQLGYSLKRYAAIDELAQEMNREQIDYITKRRDRLKLVAPSAGKVRLMVGKNSFAALGSVLLQIEK
jgi:multidrug resistance efflux pump